MSPFLLTRPAKDKIVKYCVGYLRSVKSNMKEKPSAMTPLPCQSNSKSKVNKDASN